MVTAAQKLRWLKQQNKERQKEFRQRMQDQGYKSITFFALEKSIEIINALQKEQSLSRQDALELIIAKYVEPVATSIVPPEKWANRQEDLFQPDWTDRAAYRVFLIEEIPKHIRISPGNWKEKAQILNEAGIFSSTGKAWKGDSIRLYVRKYIKA